MYSFKILIKLIYTFFIHFRVIRKYTYWSVITFAALIFLFMNWNNTYIIWFRKKLTFVNARNETFSYKLSNQIFAVLNNLIGNIFLLARLFNVEITDYLFNLITMLRHLITYKGHDFGFLSENNISSTITLAKAQR